MHLNWGRERRYVVVRQDINRRKKTMGKTLPLFANEIEIRDYRYSVWITSSQDAAYDVWTMCKPRANDENTIKELKEDFALGGFSMKKFYAVEAAMIVRGPHVQSLFALQARVPWEERKEAASQNPPLQVFCAPCPVRKRRKGSGAADIGAKQEGKSKALLPVRPHCCLSSTIGS
jgi:hypothetical protein